MNQCFFFSINVTIIKKLKNIFKYIIKNNKNVLQEELRNETIEISY